MTILKSCNNDHFMIIQEKKLVLTVNQDNLRNYCTLHFLRIIGLLPGDHGQFREKPSNAF